MYGLAKLKQQQRGDTIIEVMVALSIMGVIIAGAYTTASRATRGAQMAQERIQAVKVAEHQTEVMREYAGRFTDTDINNPNPALNKNIFINNTFCINPRNQQVVVWASGDPSSTSMFDDNLAVHPSGSYPNGCISEDGRYFFSVKRNGNVFTTTVRWDRIGGGRDQVSLKSRFYKPIDF